MKDEKKSEKKDKDSKKDDKDKPKAPVKRYVHLIPHSHTSEGFMSTPDNYFSGSENNQIYIGGVRDILDSVVSEMIDNKNLTFTYAEIKYFK